MPDQDKNYDWDQQNWQKSEDASATNDLPEQSVQKDEDVKGGYKKIHTYLPADPDAQT